MLLYGIVYIQIARIVAGQGRSQDEPDQASRGDDPGGQQQEGTAQSAHTLRLEGGGGEAGFR